VFPILAVIGLAFAMWLVLSNFTLVTGGSVTVSTVLALIPVAALVLGIVLGKRFRLDAVEEDSPAPDAAAGVAD
jgi:uncharacterized membrane protein